MKKNFAEAIAKKRIKFGFRALAGTMEPHAPKKYGWQEECIEHDEAYNVTGITDQGAYALLKTTGYL